MQRIASKLQNGLHEFPHWVPAGPIPGAVMQQLRQLNNNGLMQLLVVCRVANLAFSKSDLKILAFLMHLFFLKIKCNAIQKCSTCAQTSIQWQAHSSNCRLTLKNACVECSLGRNFWHCLNIVLEVGLVKKWFHHHWSGWNIQRLEHDAILEWHHTYS